MSKILDLYRKLKAPGVKLIPFEAHAGMAFFFSTIALNLSTYSHWFWLVMPAMLVVIAIKEWADMKILNNGYSVFDLMSWAAGVVLAVAVSFI